MSDRNWFYVSRDEEGWKVHSDENNSEDKRFPEKREAVIYGREVARLHEPSLLVIQ